MYLTIGIIFILDAIIIMVWQIVDPMYRIVENLPKESYPDDDLDVVPQLEHCESKNQSIWLGRMKYWLML